MNKDNPCTGTSRWRAVNGLSDPGQRGLSCDRESDTPVSRKADAMARFRALVTTGMALAVIAASVFLHGCSEAPSKPAAVAPPSPVPAYDGTIVALGNSLTAGLGVPEDQAYPAQLARRLQADGYNYRVVNAGISGETSSGALARIDWVVASLKPDIVIVETGANDGLRGLDPTLLEANLDQLVSRLVAQKIQVILAGMLMLPNLGPEYTRAFGEIYPRVASNHDLIFIPFFLEGVAGREAFNQADRLHPNADGYARIVETVYPFVVAAIQRHRPG